MTSTLKAQMFKWGNSISISRTAAILLFMLDRSNPREMYVAYAPGFNTSNNPNSRHCALAGPFYGSIVKPQRGEDTRLGLAPEVCHANRHRYHEIAVPGGMIHAS